MVKRKKGREEKIIELKNVHKYYEIGEDYVKAVNGVDLIIKKGDFVAIVGPSGSGKSTMMNLVGALDFATNGDIFLDSINIEELEESELAQIRGRKIGFVFQTFNLIPTMTAIENVMLPMTFQGISIEERRERAEKLLNEIGLGHRLDHLPSELSGGER
ncbi:ATP-binding cassette domain-containing protein, partial [Candidatus Pacearchaeota archaeon]|nr:ATP-binding cassette domain-containing protein [Candidatus Pacearchaeota archaeon]